MRPPMRGRRLRPTHSEESLRRRLGQLTAWASVHGSPRRSRSHQKISWTVAVSTSAYRYGVENPSSHDVLRQSPVERGAYYAVDPEPLGSSLRPHVGDPIEPKVTSDRPAPRPVGPATLCGASSHVQPLPMAITACTGSSDGWLGADGSSADGWPAGGIGHPSPPERRRARLPGRPFLRFHVCLAAPLAGIQPA